MADAMLSLDGTTLRLTGPLTFKSVPALEERLQALLPRLPTVTVLDLQAVSRVDSAGMALLVEFWRRCCAGGGQLNLAAMPAALQPLLHLYGLESMLTMAQDPPASSPHG